MLPNDTTLRFTVPGRVPGLNDMLDGQARSTRGKHGGRVSRYSEAKKTWTENAKVAAFVAWYALGKPSFGGPVVVSLHIVEPDRTRDPDNVAAGARKVVHDGLKAACVIGDDGWRDIAPVLPTTLSIGKPPRIEVTVTKGAPAGESLIVTTRLEAT